MGVCRCACTALLFVVAGAGALLVLDVAGTRTSTHPETRAVVKGRWINYCVLHGGQGGSGIGCIEEGVVHAAGGWRREWGREGEKEGGDGIGEDASRGAGGGGGALLCVSDTQCLRESLRHDTCGMYHTCLSAAVWSCWCWVLLCSTRGMGHTGGVLRIGAYSFCCCQGGVAFRAVVGVTVQLTSISSGC